MSNRKTAESVAFGNRLREARLNSVYPQQAALATCVGVSAAAIADYEHGRRNPSAPVLAKLCSALAVDPAWLYGMYPQDPAVRCPLMEVAKQPVGKHEKAYVAAMKKEQEQDKTDEDGDIYSTMETLDQLIDALDGLMKVMPGYLVEGSAMREALQGDPNGDHAPAYVSLLSSQPGVVNFYRERTHMRRLAQDGTISPSEYDHWYLGRREKLAEAAMKRGSPAPCGTSFASQGELREAVKGSSTQPVLKCTSEKI